MSGMDYKDFINFLLVIAKPRLDFLQHSKKPLHRESQSEHAVVFEEWIKAIKMVEFQEEFTGNDYCKYDVVIIHKCATAVKSDKSFQELDDQSCKLKVDELLSEITSVLGHNTDMWGQIALKYFDPRI